MARAALPTFLLQTEIQRALDYIARRDVPPDEVEQLCHGPFITSEARHYRLILIGPTAGGRIFAAILDPVN